MMSTIRRVVFVLVDGARPDVFTTLLRQGDLPNIARLVVEPGAFATATTVFPSTTGVGYLPFLFGRFPGHAGIPGIRWLDRAESAGKGGNIWRAARSYCGPQGPWLNHDITAAPSMFECVRESLAICTPVTRGLAARSHLIPVARAVLGSAAHYLGTYAELDRAVAGAWAETATRDWRFLFVVFPGVDGITHLKDPFHPAVLASYRLVDSALGTFATRITASGRDLPAFFVASDHGASVVNEHADIALALEAWGIPTIRHPMHLWRRGARAAVMISGNACAHVYFEPRSGRTRPLTHEEIPQDTLRRLLDLPAVRVAACRAADGSVMVLQGDRRARIALDPAGIRYEPINGDPLGIGTASLFEDRELLAITRRGELPDAPRQLLQVLSSPRAGDIVLAARSGTDFRGPWELPEHRAGHGSLVPEHMLVPVASSIPLPNAPIRTVDIMPTMLQQLGADIPAGLDGVAFSRIRVVEETV